MLLCGHLPAHAAAVHSPDPCRYPACPSLRTPGSAAQTGIPDPIISSDKVFISSGYNHGGALLKVSAQGAEKVWGNKNLRNHFNSCVLWQGHLYGPDDSGLRCVAFDTGELKWIHREFGKGSLMMADGKFVALSDKGELMVIQPDPGSHSKRPDIVLST